LIGNKFSERGEEDEGKKKGKKLWRYVS